MSADLDAVTRKALEERSEAAALPRFEAHLVTHPDDAAAWHLMALLLRALDRRTEALEALNRAERHEPDNPAIAHAVAQISLESGLPAAELFERALALAPDNRQVRLGWTSARFAAGDGAQALEDLGRMLETTRDWLDGHRQFAQLAAMIGRPQRATESLDRAIAALPKAGTLHLMAIETLLTAERFTDGLEAIGRAEALFGEAPVLLLNRAVALDELGDRNRAADLFDRLGPAKEKSHAVRRLRHLLRSGRPEQATAELEPWLDRAATEFWPYAALAWRAHGDPRSEWLEGSAGLYRVVDLDPAELDLAGLAERLRAIHAGAGRFLDQSVRLGTQTDGPLLGRCEPEIVRLRDCLIRRVGEHIAGLPAPDLAHPTLGRRRDQPVRFSGSWSVRLADSGYHASHHHPQGWFSSALYIAVPGTLQAGEGVLALGEAPADLGLDLPARLVVEPRPGRLVLFPSTMWHATRPFRTGERMSVAFDVAPP